MSSTTIAGLLPWEALDSRGNPTVACAVRLASGATAAATVPAGASKGQHEASERRDGGERYGGRGVRAAVAAITSTLAEAVIGEDAADTGAIDDRLREADGSADLGVTGANAVLAVSIASALAAAAAERLPLWRWLQGDDRPPLLPLPMVNILSGGAHARGGIDIQDFLAVPVGAATFSEAIEWVWRVRDAARLLTRERGLEADLVADEGGLGPALPSNEAAAELLAAAIEHAGLEPGEEVGIAIDVAAGQLSVSGGGYRLASERRDLDREQLIDELAGWVRRYPIVSLEDPLDEDDWDGWAEVSSLFGSELQLIGDDLFATDPDRLRRGAAAQVANAVLVKPNQIGTLSEARAVCEIASEAGYATVASARSGDTEDAWLTDLAVGWRAGQLKVGSLQRSERTAKWNRLLRLEAEWPDAEFAGRAALAPFVSARGMR